MSRIRASSAFVATLLLAGCSDLARLVSPAGSTDLRPARVAFTTSVATRSAADVVSLKVTSSYLLAGGTKVPISVQTLALSDAASQAVPIPVDLATCLVDTNRDGAAQDGGCSVVLELSLMVNSVVVDQQVVGPLRLAPGGRTEIAQPVALFEIASLDVTPAGPLALTIGASQTVGAVVKDSRGGDVTDRVVTWSSEAPSIATVDAAGKVTAVSAGQTRITATLGALTSSTLVNVSKPPVALVIAPSAGSGSGVVKSTPAGIDCKVTAGALSGTCSANFAADASVTLTSTADAGQLFGAWGGECVGNAVGVSCTLGMTQARSASVQFTTQRRVTVTAAAGSDGRGRITGPFGIDCRIDGATASGACSADVADGTSVTLANVPDGASGSVVEQRFGGWSGDCANAQSPSCVVTTTGGNRTVTASFRGGKLLTVDISGSGGGTVSSSDGIACTRSGAGKSGACGATVPHGTLVTLTAVANGQSTFGGWTGACAGQGEVCVVPMTQANTASVAFPLRTVQLTLTLAGAGDGAVTVNGIPACSRTASQVVAPVCQLQLELGSTASIAATTSGQTTFLGHSGDCAGTGSCTLIMSTNRSVTSTFAGKPPVSIFIEGIGSVGSGSIRSSEPTPIIDCPVKDGIASGAKCSANVPAGTVLTLRAVGNTANALAFWGSACASATTHECTVTVNEAMTAGVGFVPARDVEMRLAGTGLGTVTFQPAAAPSQAPCSITTIGVAVSCRFSLPLGSLGVFRGTPTGGARFDGFVGPCDESTGSTPVPVCTYKGIGFLLVINGTFTK